MHLTKALSGVTVKDADLGLVEAVFATYGVVDKDRDLTMKGALPIGEPVVISAYGHGSHKGMLPAGKGVLVEDGDNVILKGEFLMETTHGRDTFLTVKALSEDDLQEWSYSLEGVEAVPATVDGQRVRQINKVGRVKEVSPVLIGAGVNTRTISVKSQTKQLVSEIRSAALDAGRARWAGPNSWVWIEDMDLDEGLVIFEVEDPTGCRYYQVDLVRDGDAVTLGDTATEVTERTTFVPAKGGARFVEHVKSVVADVDGLVARAAEVVALRAEKGKSIAEDTAAELKQLAVRLSDAQGAVAALVDTPISTSSAEAEAEFLRFVAASNAGA